MELRRAVWCLALAGLLGSGATAQAKYLPTPLHDMLGSSDLILTGTIAEVRSETFVLRVDKLVAGEHDAPTVEVMRFEDWTCAARWAPYAEGQRVLLCLFQARTVEGAPCWRIRSGGGEGELPIGPGEDGVDVVYHRRGNLPYQGAERYELHGGELYGVQIPLARLLRAIRGYRRCFTWELDRSTPTPRVVAARAVDTEAIDAFAAQGDFEAWLVQQTLADRSYQD